MGMGLQSLGIGRMGLKLMGMGWGRGNLSGDGADVHYRVTLQHHGHSSPSLSSVFRCSR